MSFKSISTYIICVLVALALSTADVGAGHKSKKILKGIGVAVGATALAIAAASAANAHRDKDRYDYHHGMNGRQNAVAACVHRADKVVRRAGGLYARLDKVNKVDRKGRRRFKVVARMTGIYPWGHKRSKVRCTVKHDHVQKFKYN
jgi:hypothetical protein